MVGRAVPPAVRGSASPGGGGEYRDVLLELRSDASELKVGDFVRVTVTVAGKEDVAVVPRAALLRNTEGHFVYVVNGSRLLRAAVKVGGEQDGFVEIKDGLLAGDRIAVAGVPMLWCAESIAAVDPQ